MQTKKLKTCAETMRSPTHGVSHMRFPEAHALCTYIYNPQDLYDSHIFQAAFLFLFKKPLTKVS
jgi:hypothetical protein